MTTEGMRILIAPDKFKGALSAREAADSIATGLRDVLPNAKIDIAPVADGGEGTADDHSEHDRRQRENAELFAHAIGCSRGH